MNTKKHVYLVCFRKFIDKSESFSRRIIILNELTDIEFDNDSFLIQPLSENS